MTAQANPLKPWTFDELVREGMSLIPGHAPDWTNHNPSDPGITLVELLAYFTEVLVYRLSRVTPDAKLQFLRLLKGARWTDWRLLVGAPAEAIDRALDQAVRELGHCECATTAADFEQLAIEAASAHLGPNSHVRALCVGSANLERSLRGARVGDSRAHVTVVVVPQRELEPDAVALLCAQVRQQLGAHCLLTTRLHVIGPVYLHLALGFRIALRPDVTRQQALAAIDANLQRRFGPWLDDAPPAEPRPLGTPVRMTEITAVIDNTEGIDFVEDVILSGMSGHANELFDVGSRVGIQIGVYSTLGLDSRLGVLPGLGAQRMQRDDAGKVTSIMLQPWEVARLHIAADAVQMIGPVAAPERPTTGADDGR